MNSFEHPAFPSVESRIDEHGVEYPEINFGLSKREYAAIKLGVPDSGNDQIDAMIRKSRRQKIAATTLQSLTTWGVVHVKKSADEAVAFTDALLEKLEEST